MRTGWRGSLARAALGSLAAWALACGCASTRSERHLAPLFTEISRGGGGTEFEALGGVIRVRRPRPAAPYDQFALRPLLIKDRTPTGETISRFLTPFGTSKDRGSEYTWQLLPIARYYRHYTNAGDLEWTFIALPGIYWARKADGRILRAWFPFGGVFEDFLSYDRLVFVLFPLYARSERHGYVTYSFLFPVFSLTLGPNESGIKGWRLWPLYGTSRVDGSYQRSFFLWPIFQWERNHMWQSREKHEVKWMVFPLVGRTRRDTYRATTVLWPFFGYASDPKRNFWSWDGPWPIVRLHHDPQTGTFRTRFWPLYSRYQGDGLDSTWFLWPLLNVRSEEYTKATKRSVYIFPFWQSWIREDEEAGQSSFIKFWPLYQVERAEHVHRISFPELNPLWRTPEIDEMYGWIWELYSRERVHDIVHERSWLGVYRREKDALEDRASIVGLWARRKHGPNMETSDYSLLFGLLRWRKGGPGSLEWLAPALPGPGWPLVRESPEVEAR